jgi:addiction module HigA family antidote
MSKPPHPGEILKKDIFPELGVSVTEASLKLGITRVGLSRVINGRSAVSTNLALKLEEWLGGPSAEVWLGMQIDHDLWKARNKTKLKS